MANDPQRRYASLSARRGREAYIQIRTQLHRLRSQHIEPVCVWVNQATADDMHALWFEVTAVTGGRSNYDGQLPTIAGLRVKVGSTGGADYAFEYHESRAFDHAARDVMGKQWQVVDNPLDGTH
jgi:hypothetical protein